MTALDLESLHGVEQNVRIGSKADLKFATIRLGKQGNLPRQFRVV